jgi:hypothetical protein
VAVKLNPLASCSLRADRPGIGGVWLGTTSAACSHGSLPVAVGGEAGMFSCTVSHCAHRVTKIRSSTPLPPRSPTPISLPPQAQSFLEGARRAACRPLHRVKSCELPFCSDSSSFLRRSPPPWPLLSQPATAMRFRRLPSLPLFVRPARSCAALAPSHFCSRWWGAWAAVKTQFEPPLACFPKRAAVPPGCPRRAGRSTSQAGGSFVCYANGRAVLFANLRAPLAYKMGLLAAGVVGFLRSSS